MNFKQFKQQARMKRWDIVLLLLLVCLSFVPWGITAATRLTGEHVFYEATLRVDGQVIKTFSLSHNTTYEFKDSHNDYNKIVVKDNTIRIKEANCSDQVCVRRGAISRGGETIVCLPHRLVIEVIASDGSRDGSVIY